MAKRWTLHQRGNKKIGGVEFPYTVEDGKLFVMGDNREESMDSQRLRRCYQKTDKGKSTAVHRQNLVRCMADNRE